MPVNSRDPLLTALRIVIYVCIGILCFVSFVLVVASPLIVFFQADIFAELAEDGKVAPSGLIPLIVVLALGFAAILIAAIYFFWNLLAITDTVRAGDPFIPENASRLTRMGWLAVFVQFGSLLLVGPGVFVASVFADAGEDATFDVDFDGTGLILILVLFVLARVFRHGAAMREDLEGTV